jgi:hypothetical protein
VNFPYAAGAAVVGAAPLCDDCHLGACCGALPVVLGDPQKRDSVIAAARLRLTVLALVCFVVADGPTCGSTEDAMMTGEMPRSCARPLPSPQGVQDKAKAMVHPMSHVSRTRAAGRRATRDFGGLPAIMAALIAPIEMPAIQSG